MRAKVPRAGANKPKPGRARMPRGLSYTRAFISRAEKEAILAWLATIHPIWERRFSTLRPPPEGEEQRWLLRPVYWLGNWQFACLDYYHPPRGIHDRCVRAEPYPPALAAIVARIEARARALFTGPEMPRDWRLNTCLINFYGARIRDGRREDVARVGEHKDFEPGPVASLSLGERAFFQFVESRGRGTREGVVFQQWLEEGALQIFGGKLWKDRYFHRVQRVDRKLGASFRLNVEDFETRRINFTFRYVPEEHILRYKDLSPTAAADAREYMEALARHSAYFRAELAAASRPAP